MAQACPHQLRRGVDKEFLDHLRLLITANDGRSVNWEEVTDKARSAVRRG
jgi:hypothetical protein